MAQAEVGKMKQVILKLKNQPGELARVCNILRRDGINIESIFGGGLNEQGMVHLITSDSGTAERAFRKSGYEPKVNEIVTVKLEDKPGELWKVAERLSKNKVNINWIYLLAREKGQTTVALDVDKPREAERILK